MDENKKAFAVNTNADGTFKILASADGREAEQMIEAAFEKGLEVVKSSSMVEELEASSIEQSAQAWDMISMLVAEIQGFVEEVDSEIGKR